MNIRTRKAFYQGICSDCWKAILKGEPLWIWGSLHDRMTAVHLICPKGGRDERGESREVVSAPTGA